MNEISDTFKVGAVGDVESYDTFRKTTRMQNLHTTINMCN